ncbi:hypothetical protein BJJLLNOG_00115 [Ostreid herpesvirus 1]|nr:hypothetical protein MNKOMGEJ_00115 [Ostreid herpesvirus 1]UPX74400.1 hypothetical protein AFLJNOPI_00115 [Ostreid herpesvirus 1]UPX74561.1 hypothetical protein CJMPFHDB_00115 [Ostreid herpesvirus 1]UPX74725.1 hypothetical protein ICNGKBDJ_00117 [Ostreid herpesvirus 1]UPX74888.1 hypothetical protein IJGDABAG_00116 [Ostreid herpesvirus 1]
MNFIIMTVYFTTYILYNKKNENYNIGYIIFFKIVYGI